MVPEVVTGVLDAVRPVVPPDKPTLVTVPVPASDQLVEDPSVLRN
jgi:hypothetical protein